MRLRSKNLQSKADNPSAWHSTYEKEQPHTHSLCGTNVCLWEKREWLRGIERERERERVIEVECVRMCLCVCVCVSLRKEEI